jgi:hypothetical protein
MGATTPLQGSALDLSTSLQQLANMIAIRHLLYAVAHVAPPVNGRHTIDVRPKLARLPTEAAPRELVETALAHVEAGTGVIRTKRSCSRSPSARLEKIAGRLGRSVVASEGFASICRSGWSDLGDFPISGFSRAARVYGLVDEASQAHA